MLRGFAKDTNILMNDGSVKEIQELETGDEIMDTNGKSITIKNNIKEKSVMYEITPNKGNKIVLSENNYLVLKVSNYEFINWDINRQRYLVNWVENFTGKAKSFPLSNFIGKKSSSKTSKKSILKQRAHNAAKLFLKNMVPKMNGYMKYGDVVKIKVKDFLKLTKHNQSIFKLHACGLDFQEREIDMDPYIFGYWLGDGTSVAPEITTAEQEVVDVFDQYAGENDLIIKNYRKYHYSLTTGKSNKGKNKMINSLKKYKVWGDKHIPIDYKFNSRVNRLKLLAGLVDSDGHNDKNCYAFTFKSEKLADDVIFIARTLGFRAYKKQCQKTCTNSRRGKVTGTYYSFIVYGEGIHEVPSILERKKTHPRLKKQNALVIGFKMKSIGKANAYHLEFEGKRKRFLLDDFTVVHN